jgi:hypothetical protein
MIPLSIRFNHAPAHGKLQKFFTRKVGAESGPGQERPQASNVYERVLLTLTRGKGVIDVSHSVNNAFSIVKRPQRGAVVHLTI